jgi:peptidoglycan/xylan/chitin deacetylase (PgdA/CDA1 family)
VQHVATRERVVFLTIDDGIVRDPAFLALVRREHLPVTVFITDSVLAGTHAAYFRALQAAGATIENHTLSHPYLTRVSPTERRRQICDAQAQDRRVFGHAPTLFRPPYGAVSPEVISTALACGVHAVIGWDAVMPRSGGLQTWNGRPVLHPGDIVLMHFLVGLTGQVQRLQRLAREQHLRFALLENYV